MSRVDDIFPFPSFREYQRGALVDAIDALEDGKNVILDLPTGIGKSPILVALGRWAGDAWYTTPQRELRQQLREDPDLKKHYKVLRARKDLMCMETEDPCDECEYYNDPGLSCNESGRQCTYMSEIGETVVNDIGVLTMSRLLISGQKEFASYLKPRELLMVDEAQSLEDQVASMHASISISPDEMPRDVFGPATENIETPDYDGDDPDLVLTAEEIWTEIKTIRDRINGYIDHNENDPEKTDEVRNCKAVSSQLGHFFKEHQEDRTWVVNVDEETWDDCTAIELKPVEVDWFLNRFFWTQGEQIVLSSATIPYRENEEQWLDQLGLDPDSFEIIRRPSPFPPTNRMVHTRWELGKMSQEEDEIWDRVMDSVAGIAHKHEGQKGLIHTASYDRAQRIVEESDEWDELRDNVMADESGESLVEEWQERPEDIMCSPAMTEGVDLAGDKCEWQILMKVPYPHPSDARVQYMLQNDRWYWYMQKGAVSVLQSVGRAVRSREDEADFYVLDGSFEDVRGSVKFPEWFTEAIS